MKAPDATRCSTRSRVTAKRQAMASPENQRAATDPNNDLDLARNLDLDLDRDLDSPTATAFSATAVVPAVAPAVSLSPPEAPNLKKHPMSYLPAHPDWFLCLTCKGGRHRIQNLQCMKCDEKHGKLNKRPAEHRALHFVCLKHMFISVS
jgi:hypothetical protein